MSNDSYDRRVNMFWSRIAGVYDLVENVFDKAVAANVIHQLDDHKKAIDELRPEERS